VSGIPEGAAHTMPSYGRAARGPLAVVTRILEVTPHPDPIATRTEVIHILVPPGLCADCPPPAPGEPQGGRGAAQPLVTGKHYRAGDLGVWLRPGGYIPGYLARSLWMVGKKRANDWFEVRSIPIGPPGGTVKVESPGLWCGMYYQTDNSAESHEHAKEMLEQGGVEVHRNAVGEVWTPEFSTDYDLRPTPPPEGFTPWIRWPYWKARWQVGDVLDDHLGVLSFDPREMRRMIAEVRHSQALESDLLPTGTLDTFPGHPLDLAPERRELVTRWAAEHGLPVDETPSS
jgi:hypothetical protein